MYKIIKIYGERNTGTQYLKKLIKLNFDLKLLPGILPKPFRIVWFLNLYFPSLYRRFPLVNWLLDYYFKITFSKNLGWKHTLIFSELLETSQINLNNVYFITITKNPYSWLLSFYNRPYHSQNKYENFEEFLLKPWKTLKCENYSKDFKNPIEMWNLKNKFYIDLKEKYIVENIRYEDLLLNLENVINKISKRFNISRKYKIAKNIEISTKDKEKNYNFYYDYYINELWKNKLNKDSINIINKFLDESVLDYFKYKKI